MVWAPASVLLSPGVSPAAHLFSHLRPLFRLSTFSFLRKEVPVSLARVCSVSDSPEGQVLC